MTRTEKRFIDRAVKMVAPKLKGAPPEVIHQVILEEIDRALEYAAEDESGTMGVEVGVMGNPSREKLTTMPQPPGLIAMPDADPESQPQTEMIPVIRKSVPLILVPGMEGFDSMKVGKPKVGVDVPLNAWKKPTKKLKRGAYQIRWQESISRLIELCNKNLPDQIAVTPQGTSQKLHIEKLNTMPDTPSGMVKVVYGLRGQVGSHKSTGGGKMGQNNAPDQLDPMQIDIVVSTTFCIEDETVNWEQRIADLASQAEAAFKPRPRELVNHTPLKQGSSLSLRDAGASVDVRSDDAGNIIVAVTDSATGAADEQAEFRRWKAQQATGVMPPPLV